MHRLQHLLHLPSTKSVPLRCTQNPTMGEEWRRGWHPEIIAPKASEDAVLVVGGGPAGLEAARALGQRGYAVTLAEAGRELGGRLLAESRLPGLATWMRVRDWRAGRLVTMSNVEIYLESALDGDQILEFGFPRVVLATGADWRPALMDIRMVPIPAASGGPLLTPDQVLEGAGLADPVVIYDYEHYVMGSCLAELLATKGHRVIFVTPGDEVAGWSRHTHDQFYAQQRLLEEGVTLVTGHFAVDYDGKAVTTRCKYTGREELIEAARVITVGTRQPRDGLYRDLVGRPGDLAAAGVRSLQKIGDCDVPGAVVHATYAGHKLAEEFDSGDLAAAPGVSVPAS